MELGSRRQHRRILNSLPSTDTTNRQLHRRTNSSEQNLRTIWTPAPQQRIKGHIETGRKGMLSPKPPLLVWWCTIKRNFNKLMNKSINRQTNKWTFYPRSRGLYPPQAPHSLGPASEWGDSPKCLDVNTNRAYLMEKLRTSGNKDFIPLQQNHSPQDPAQRATVSKGLRPHVKEIHLLIL